MQALLSARSSAPLTGGLPGSGPHRSVIGRVARGWGETVADLPGDCLALAGRTGKAIAHPVTTARGAWVDARAAHGVVVPAAAKAPDLVAVRRYMQDLDNPYDLADAVTGVNGALAKGTRAGAALATAAETTLWRERGVPANEVATLARSLDAAALKRLRGFADTYGVAQAGRGARPTTRRSSTRATAPCWASWALPTSRAWTRQMRPGAGPSPISRRRPRAPCRRGCYATC